MKCIISYTVTVTKKKETSMGIVCLVFLWGDVAEEILDMVVWESVLIKTGYAMP